MRRSVIQEALGTEQSNYFTNRSSDWARTATDIRLWPVTGDYCRATMLVKRISPAMEFF